MLIWSPLALLWYGILESVVKSFIALYLTDYQMIVVGYFEVFLLTTVVRDICEAAINATESGFLKLLFEDIYVLCSTVVNVTLWIGKLTN